MAQSEASGRDALAALSGLFINVYLSVYVLTWEVNSPRLHLGWGRWLALGLAAAACLLAISAWRRPAAAYYARTCLSHLLAAVALVIALSCEGLTVFRVLWAWSILAALLLSLRWRQRAQGAKAPLIIARLLLIVLGSNLALLSGELACRVLMMPNKDLPFLSYASARWKTSELYDPEANSWGLRERELSEFRPDGVYRILFLGDSVTFGLGVPLADTFPRLVETSLNALALPQRVETINLGWPGLNLGEEFRELKTRGAIYEPNLVVWVFFPNDVENLVGSRPQLTLVEGVDELYQNWLFYSLLRERFSALRDQLLGRPSYTEWLEASYQDPAVQQAFEQQLFNLKVWCRHNQASLAVVLFPFMEDFQHYPTPAAHATITRLCQKLDIPYLDLLPVFAAQAARQFQVHPLDHHPNGRANHLIVGDLTRFLAPLVATPQP